jgi:septum formation protein
MLLQRFGIPFECHSPDIDEGRRENESPVELAERLADEKAAAICKDHPAAIVIGSDQIALFENNGLGKPGSVEAAMQQVSSFSGRTIEFLTAVSVQSRASGFREAHIDVTRVHFRELEAAEIRRYLEAEKPYDCAGAFKAESLGITLFERIRSEDPTALIGLPLIRTAGMLRRAGLHLP